MRYAVRVTSAPGKDTPPAESGLLAAIRHDRVWTVPNVLSVLRGLGVGLLVWLLVVRRADGWALVVLVLSGVTDYLDGKLARLLGQSSRLGALLDPLVDRLYLVATVVSFVLRYLIPWWLGVVLLGRDLVLTLTLLVYRRRGLPPPEVIYLGKAATFALMAAAPWLLTGELSWPGSGVGHALGWALLLWGGGIYVWTGVLYTGKAIAVARADNSGD